MVLNQRFLEFIAEKHLFSVEDRVLLAVSGGRDSVLMVHLFATLGFNFGIAHCNFNLRGEESDADEILVKDLALQVGKAYHQKSFCTATYASINGISIQMAARELRYQWFEDLSDQCGYDYIATAHHQNDTVETMLLNLVRGTGITGLQGILPKRKKLIRPLLFLKRAEVDLYTKELGLMYRDDQSNFSNKYARNKIRLEVIPKLTEINPQLEETFMANSIRFGELSELVEVYGESLRNQLFKKQGGGYRILISEIKTLRPLSLLLYELFKPFHFQAAVLQDLMQHWSMPFRSGKKFTSPTHVLIINRDELLLLENLSVPDLPVTMINEDDKQITIDGSIMNIQFEDRASVTMGINIISVDADKLSYPLCIRSWRKGDLFYPLGMRGRKKISDYFISLKLAVTSKMTVPILTDAEGKIIWVIPYRLDDRFKITDKTKKVVTFEYLI